MPTPCTPSKESRHHECRATDGERRPRGEASPQSDAFVAADPGRRDHRRAGRGAVGLPDLHVVHRLQPEDPVHRIVQHRLPGRMVLERAPAAHRRRLEQHHPHGPLRQAIRRPRHARHRLGRPRPRQRPAHGHPRHDHRRTGIMGTGMCPPTRPTCSTASPAWSTTTTAANC